MGTAFADDRRARAQALAQLVKRARRSGAVRADVSVEDVRVGLSAISSFRSAASRTGTHVGAAAGEPPERPTVNPTS
ncbi:hypothetical protein ACIBQX_40350 [Nonomuraea sp. NPDC049714]|uniref:SbtR family transcriptional regulator n=1 Tax=Nonomuraea sp. NPDC049714 TaxID=3364357 RepID=UPI0037A6F921